MKTPVTATQVARFCDLLTNGKNIADFEGSRNGLQHKGTRPVRKVGAAVDAGAEVVLVDVDAGVGAHVMVLGSHQDKPFRWVLGSARRADPSIEVHYGPERIKTITGPAGTGFIQDSSCYHKVLAPKAADRIMLHLRYY